MLREYGVARGHARSILMGKNGMEDWGLILIWFSIGSVFSYSCSRIERVLVLFSVCFQIESV